MFKIDKKSSIIIGVIIGIISLALLFIGFMLILGYQLNINNIIAYIVFSILAGGISAAFLYFRLYPMFFAFIIGLAIGYYEMYRSFYNTITGWGDLVGVISLLIWPVFGLGAGLVLQLIAFLIKKLKK